MRSTSPTTSWLVGLAVIFGYYPVFVYSETVGSWSTWQTWSPCSVTCGFNGVRNRHRNCQSLSDDSVIDHIYCRNGSNRHEVPCNFHYCPIAGSWSSWEVLSWVAEAEDCRYTRTRECNDPHPAYGGQPCVGLDQDEVVSACQDHPIPPDHFKDCTILFENHYSTIYPLTGAYTNECENYNGGNPNYYLSGNGFTGHVFTIDLGDSYLVAGFALKNTRNENGNDRGTAGFKIEIATEVDGPFEEIVAGTLTDARSKACGSILLETFPVDPPVVFRYLKFYVQTIYGGGGGLQFFSMVPP